MGKAKKAGPTKWERRPGIATRRVGPWELEVQRENGTWVASIRSVAESDPQLGGAFETRSDGEHYALEDLHEAIGSAIRDLGPDFAPDTLGLGGSR